jgi:hypothetical protein
VSSGVERHHKVLQQPAVIFRFHIDACLIESVPDVRRPGRGILRCLRAIHTPESSFSNKEKNLNGRRISYLTGLNRSANV